MKIKFPLRWCGILWACLAGTLAAETYPVTFDKLNAYRFLHREYSMATPEAFDVNSKRVQIRYAPLTDLYFYAIHRNPAVGRHQVEINGMTLSEDSKAVIQVSLSALHNGSDGCNGRVDIVDLYRGDLPLTDTAAGTVSAEFTVLAEQLSCPLCHKTLPNSIIIPAIFLAEPPEAFSMRDLGLEIYKIRYKYDGPAPGRVQIQRGSLIASINSVKSTLLSDYNLDQREIANFKANNRLDATKEFITHVDYDRVYSMRFDEKALIRLNPDFKIKCRFNFSNGFLQQSAVCDPMAFKDVQKIVQINGNIYLKAQNYLAKFDAEKSRWLYINDNSEYKQYHGKMHKFPDDRGYLLEFGNSIRLSDGQIFKAPEGIRVSTISYSAVLDKMFWLGHDNKSIIEANGDFTNPQPYNLALPPFSGVKYAEINDMMVTEDGRRMLVVMEATFGTTEITLIFEVDLVSGTVQSKMPFWANRLYMFGRTGKLMTCGQMLFLDPGAGKPLIKTMATNKSDEQLDAPLQILPIHEKMWENREDNFCGLLGQYAVVTDCSNSQVWLLNLQDLTKSYRLNGLYKFYDIRLAPDQKSIWLVNRHGWYEVALKNPGPEFKPQFEQVDTTGFPRPVKISDAVTDIVVNEASLFNAELEDEQVNFTVNPLSAETSVTLELNLPNNPANPQVYILEFKKSTGVIKVKVFDEFGTLKKDAVNYVSGINRYEFYYIYGGDSKIQISAFKNKNGYKFSLVGISCCDEKTLRNTRR